ncbi:sensor histidine kinase [Methanoplanus endosymbiosus]|uniref:histidine kinase n=1 Tax=Methanoplanus endosymbiosus TaxID=33865 RepID=A0A9E7PK57_9EURY|nr:HAMP domain-containing sensor histidine kinase [Methanoplanus endosymbiosus]UUX91443.1 HAMP domain-containing histidine kinase [Methanoplanus endosymbiosus]
MQEGVEKKASQQTKLALGFFVIFFILILIISVATYTTFRTSFETQYDDRMDDAVVVVINHVNLVNTGLNTYENAYDRELLESFSLFSEAYENSGGDPSAIDLNVLRDNIRLSNFGTLELYIINESGVVEYSTYKPDIGLDFSRYPEFFEKIDTIRKGDVFVGDRATGGWSGDVNLKKYAYLPTYDHKYLLEFGFTSEVFEEGRKVFKYGGIGDLLSEQNYNLVSSKVYNIAFKEVGGDLADDLTRENLRTVFKEGCDLEYINSSGETITEYIFIDLNDGSSPSSSQMNLAVKLVFSTENLNDTLDMLSFYIWMFIILASAISLLSAYYIAYYFTKPIRSIIRDIEVIAGGDLDHPINKTQSAEGEYLRGEIEILVRRLKGEIELLQKTSDNLDSELEKNRRKEEELKKVNKKLTLISGITLHDIQNQILALSSYVYYMRLNRENGKDDDDYFKFIDDIVLAVKDHISFASDYRQVGLKKPVWQNIGVLVDEIIRKSPFPDINFTVSTGNLTVLADSMFKRVLFNLFENSVRHGKGVTSVSVSFYESEGSGHLIIEDDGCGVPEKDKERIFEKKFGENTGLGLFLVREILATSGMAVYESGTEGEGARFEISIPEGYYRFR